jgi:hypothetical protein
VPVQTETLPSKLGIALVVARALAETGDPERVARYRELAGEWSRLLRLAGMEEG